MKATYRILLIFHFYSMCIILFNCTESPFFKQDEISNNTIKGRVELSDHSSPNNVYVWFRALDISTRTDENGCFELQCPSPSSQPGGGVDGIFNIYFYVANYRLDSVGVTIFNGNVKFSEEGLNSRGELAELIVLSKILDVEASIDSVSIPVTQDTSGSHQDTSYITFTVQAIREPVTVTSSFSNSAFKGDPQFMTAFLKKIDSEQNFVKTIYREDRGHRTTHFEINIHPVELLPLMIILEPGMLPPGEYEVIPYLLIQQKNIPPGLIKSLGENVEYFCPDFLNIPLKVENNRFRIFTDE